ncbi:MAG: acyltransferase [Spirochaetaceae bacterium]|jgi:peptidoglycan/LPS O-acetylase OafA/YrhL|nr:acyltransferase [Spirochaetaceae bacterium]
MRQYKEIIPPPPQQHYGALDGLRGISAFTVAFIYHYVSFNPAVYPFSKILYWPYHFGWTLIDLFYVLSGFIFFEKYRQPVAERNLSFKKYCILRFSRLYPLHWLTLLITALFVLFRGISGLPQFPINGDSKYSVPLFLLNIPLIQYGWVYSAHKSFNGNSWTLSIEIMMYLIFFALVFCSRSYKRTVIGSAALVCIGVLLGVIKQIGFNFPILGVCQGMIGFFAGCITAGVYDYCGKNRKLSRVVTSICICLILLSLFLSFAPKYISIFSALLAYSSMGYWVVVYSFLLFPALVFVILQIKFMTRLFSIKPLRYLGQISYSIYLIHFPAALATVTTCDFFNIKIDYSKNIAFFAYMALILFLSHLSHFKFEMPLQAWIRKKAALRGSRNI